MKTWLALLLASLLVAWADGFLVASPDEKKPGTRGQTTNATIIGVSPRIPGLPEKLVPRRLNGHPDPSRQEVRAMMARARLGLEREPEWATLIERLSGLDFRDYPEEYAGVVHDTAWLHELDLKMLGKFRANDEPAFVKALLARYEAEKDTMRPFTELAIADLLTYMTNSPVLVPVLSNGLATTSSVRLFAGCVEALSNLATLHAATALVERSKVASDVVEPSLEFSRKLHCYFGVSGLRNPDLLPYLESELAKAEDPRLATHLKAAIMATQRGWPSNLSNEQWKMVTDK